MSDINGISNVGGVGGDLSSGAVAGMSPDTLLTYCAMQLDGLDGQIKTQMDQQQKALDERQALQKAQQVMEQFGTKGPQSPQEMKQCVDALDQCANTLGPNDPVAAQIKDFKQQVESKYGYSPPRLLTQDEQNQLNQFEKAPLLFGVVNLFQPMIDHLNQVQTVGTLANPPDAGSEQWKGTTDALNNIASDIKDGAEIQMMQLQDLVSKRQTAVQLVTNMMSKMADTTLSVAKNV